jgi:hypothetical protein
MVKLEGIFCDDEHDNFGERRLLFLDRRFII